MEASSPSQTKSPRTSIDGQTLSSSPRFQSLHRRFRSSSTTTSIASDTVSTKDPGSPVKKTEAIKSVKRFLLSNVRNDWSFPSEGVSDILSEVHLESREPIDYRPRVDASSDFDSDGLARRRGAAARARNNEIDPYKFDSPDAVGTSLANRKAKKRKMFEEEQVWNTGLKTWAQRREAWTGAVNTRPGKRKEKGSPAGLGITDYRKGSGSTDTSSTSPKRNSKTISSSTESVEPLGVEDGPWLPVFPPLLPDDNPVRANINPAAYPTIYSKVVIQSLTPTVPISLSHMTYALVEGWKADGAWPPQGSVPATAVVTEGSKKTSAILKFRKQRLNGEKGRVRKGLGAVKKALVGEQPPPVAGDPAVDMDFEEQLDAEAADNSELNKGLLESSTGRRNS